jgi:hypothetical protein
MTDLSGSLSGIPAKGDICASFTYSGYPIGLLRRLTLPGVR